MVDFSGPQGPASRVAGSILSSPLSVQHLGGVAASGAAQLAGACLGGVQGRAHNFEYGYSKY